MSHSSSMVIWTSNRYPFDRESHESSRSTPLHRDSVIGRYTDVQIGGLAYATSLHSLLTRHRVFLHRTFRGTSSDIPRTKIRDKISGGSVRIVALVMAYLTMSSAMEGDDSDGVERGSKGVGWSSNNGEGDRG